MKNSLLIVGTSHVSTESVRQVKNAFKEFIPDIVALELDQNRAHALLHDTKRPKNLTLLKTLGLGGFLFFLFGELVQKKIGKVVNIEPGKEMLTGLKIGMNNNCKIALIDRKIELTLQRFSKYFKKRELLKFIIDIIFSPFSKNDIGKIDFSKVPQSEVIDKVLGHVKKRYPSLYKILIDERDRYMAKHLLLIMKDNPGKKILAVVGAGHVKGIKKYLRHLVVV